MWKFYCENNRVSSNFMKKIVTSFLIILTFHSLQGQDTVRYPSGNINWIKFDKYGFERIDYYENGKIKRIHKPENFFFCGTEINYDTLGRLESKGKIKYIYVKHGTWKYYKNGVFEKRIKYKYDLVKSKIKTKKGKGKVCFLTYGKVCMISPCEDATDKYRVEFIAVAGCHINENFVRKIKFHNFFINIIQTIKYGSSWKRKAFEYCDKK